MSFDRQIQDKFSGFEPEVPDGHIDAGWEKISYFLPQEEKKKRAFFFYRSAKGMGIAVMAVFITLLVFWLIKEPGKTGTISMAQRTAPATRAIAADHSDEHPAVLRHSPEKHPGIPGTSAPGMKQAYKSASHDLAPASSGAQQRPALSAITEDQANTGHASATKSKTNNTLYAVQHPYHAQAATDPAIAPVNTGGQLPHSYRAAGLMALLKQASLDRQEAWVPDPELALHNTDRTDPAPPEKRKAALELFAGLSNRSLMLQADQSKNTVQANGVSAGLAGIFPVKAKLYLSGQLMYSYNPVQYLEKTEAITIIKREVPLPPISSLNNPRDTLVYYVPYTSGFRLESSDAWHLSGGMGYELLNRGRISLDGALFINLTRMRFSYDISRLNSDTGIFVNNVSTPDAASFYARVEKSVSPAPVSEKKQVLGLGLNPSLSLVYQLNKKAGLMLRPGCMIPLFPTVLGANDKSYRLRNNQWFITLGLRYRL